MSSAHVFLIFNILYACEQYHYKLFASVHLLCLKNALDGLYGTIGSIIKFHGQLV